MDAKVFPPSFMIATACAAHFDDARHSRRRDSALKTTHQVEGPLNLLTSSLKPNLNEPIYQSPDRVWKHIVIGRSLALSLPLERELASACHMQTIQRSIIRSIALPVAVLVNVFYPP